MKKQIPITYHSASVEGLMELPLKKEKIINQGIEKIESLGNRLFRGINRFVRNNPKMPKKLQSTLRAIASWAKTAGKMKWIPGIRHSSAKIRRIAKTGRTILRAARGGAVAGAVIAVAIESYCLTTCCFKSSRDYFEDRLNQDPSDFMFGFE